MKQVPNIVTLLNLFFGCIAIVYIMQPGLMPLYQEQNGLYVPDVDESGMQYIGLPEQIYWGSFFIGIAAAIDFLDGFTARLFSASSSIGKQLDSLADVVSFGVAPGMIVYQFLRLSYAQHTNGLSINELWLLPAFIIPCAGAYRLGRFNIDDSQKYGFKGVPIPAAGLLVASFPLIYWFSNNSFVIGLLINEWFWYVLIGVVSYLMVSTLPMLAFKFQQITFKELLPFIILVFIAILSAFFSGWFAVPITFVVYIVLSLILLKRTHDISGTN